MSIKNISQICPSKSSNVLCCINPWSFASIGSLPPAEIALFEISFTLSKLSTEIESNADVVFETSVIGLVINVLNLS